MGRRSESGVRVSIEVINEDKDGRISPDEYREFQVFKQKHKDWQERLKAKIGGK